MAATEELIKLAAGVLVQQFSSPYRAAFERRIGGVVVCGALAGLAGLAGLGCGIAALWLWLSPLMGEAEAALLCMLTLLVAAFLLLLGAIYFSRHRPVANPVLKDVLNNKELIGMLEKHIPDLVIAAAIAGIVFGMRGRRQK
jgi:hypothetical protein